jgi:hypothetical protein
MTVVITRSPKQCRRRHPLCQQAQGPALDNVLNQHFDNRFTQTCVRRLALPRYHSATGLRTIEDTPMHQRAMRHHRKLTARFATYRASISNVPCEVHVCNSQLKSDMRHVYPVRKICPKQRSTVHAYGHSMRSPVAAVHINDCPEDKRMERNPGLDRCTHRGHPEGSLRIDL